MNPDWIPVPRQLFFWFFPPGPQGSLDDLIFWWAIFKPFDGNLVYCHVRTNGGPGCSSLEGLLEENGVCCEHNIFSSFWYWLVPGNLSLSNGVLGKRSQCQPNLVGPISPVSYGWSNRLVRDIRKEHRISGYVLRLNQETIDAHNDWKFHCAVERRRPGCTVGRLYATVPRDLFWAKTQEIIFDRRERAYFGFRSCPFDSSNTNCSVCRTVRALWVWPYLDGRWKFREYCQILLTTSMSTPRRWTWTYKGSGLLTVSQASLVKFQRKIPTFSTSSFPLLGRRSRANSCGGLCA